MKAILQYHLIVMLLCFFGCALGPVTFSDLELRNNVYYRKGESKPFTGRVHHIQDVNGRREEYALLNGRPHGPYLEWEIDGSLLTCIPYDNEQVHGYYLRWWPNGTLACHMEFKFGQPHGEKKEWWDNGQLMSVTSYTNGQPSDSINWDEKGNRITARERAMRVHMLNRARKEREPEPEGDGLKPAP